jgi:hypothetical protein
VLRFVGVLQHLIQGLLGSGTEHHETHRVTGRFTRDRRVLEKDIADLVVDI